MRRVSRKFSTCWQGARLTDSLPAETAPVTPSSPMRGFDGYRRSPARPPRVLTLGVSGIADDTVVQREGRVGLVALRASGIEPPFIRAHIDSHAEVEAAMTRAGQGWALSLELPVGGPYELSASVGPVVETFAEGVLVGDLWVLAGQSNMYGVGTLRSSDPPHARVHMLDMGRQWRPAEEPLHSIAHSPDPVHRSLVEDEVGSVDAAWLAEPTRGAGLGLPFARQLVESTGIPVGLLPAAQGASSLGQWSPNLAGLGGGSLYGSMMRSIEAAGGRVCGVLWFQGETDSATPDQESGYAEALTHLIAALRRDVGQATAFYQVQLGRVTYPLLPGQEERWSRMRLHLADLRCGADGVVAAVDVELEDPIHIGTNGLRRIGKRLARLVAGEAQVITVKDVTLRGHLGDWPADQEGLNITVTFSGLRGGLLPRSHVPGFSVRTAEGAEVSLIYRAEVLAGDRDSVVLHLAAPAAGELHELGIWYGYGANPYCDLTDAEDNAVPAFGPLPVLP